MINDIIKQVYDKPCWQVQCDNNTYITFNIGQPKLVIQEPEVLIKEKYRAIGIRGEWVLWIFRCNWELFLDKKLVAHSKSSSQEIKEVLTLINGQKIVNIDINRDTGNTTLYFDLGGTLKTKRKEGIRDIQWMLINSKDNECYELVVRSDGTYKINKNRIGDPILNQGNWEQV